VDTSNSLPDVVSPIDKAEKEFTIEMQHWPFVDKTWKWVRIITAATETDKLFSKCRKYRKRYSGNSTYSKE
jgi:hypothetical protein